MSNVVKFIVVILLGLFFFFWVFGTSLLLFRPSMHAVTSPETKRIRYSDEKFTADDGTDIRYWYLQGYFRAGETAAAMADGKNAAGTSASETDKPAVILLHGIGMERSRYMEEICSVLDKGFICIVPDLRAHGLSKGLLTTLGARERGDIKTLMEKVKEKFGIERFILWGFSLGASTAILTAADTDMVVSIIADSPFDTYSSVALTTARHWFGPVPEFMINLCVWTAGLVGGFDPASVDCVKAGEKITEIPTLFIVGSEDPRAPETMTDNIMNAMVQVPEESDEDLSKAEPVTNAEKWVVPKAGHVESWETDPQGYKEKLYEVLDRF